MGNIPLACVIDYKLEFLSPAISRFIFHLHVATPTNEADGTTTRPFSVAIIIAVFIGRDLVQLPICIKSPRITLIVIAELDIIVGVHVPIFAANIVLDLEHGSPTGLTC